MKHVVSAILALVTVLLPLAGYADQAYYSIREIYEQSPDRWQGEYTNARGETVMVDCPIIVPDAETAPVLRAIWYPPLDNAFQREFAAPSKADANRYMASSKDDTTIFMYNYQNIWTERDINRKHRDARAYFLWEDIEWDKSCAFQNPLTVREAFEVIDGKAREIYTRYGGYGYYPIEPAYGVWTSYVTDKNGTPERDIGYYGFWGFETIRGIPVLGSTRVGFGAIDCGNPSESISEVKYYVLNVEAEDGYGFAAHLMAEEELLHEDIPLMHFQVAKPQIEQLIEEGRVRTIYNVRLGYEIYLEPDHNQEHFRLVPSWVVECAYYDSAKEETETYNDDQPDYTVHQHFRKLIVNAQTGKLLDPARTDRDRSDCPEIVTWDAVGGKR